MSKGYRSPFDSAIEEIVKADRLSIVCPYIDLKYFKTSIISSCENWRLLTDINEWASCIQESNIENFKTFLTNYKSMIKHLSGIHAKAIITPKKAFLGSANFTKSGICNNNEISAVIDDLKSISELNKWFNSWWNSAHEISDSDIRKIKDNELISIIKNKKDQKNINLCSRNSTINSKWCVNTTENSRISIVEDEDYLVDYLHNWGKNKEWLLSYFDIARYILQKCNISQDDERLCISFTKPPKYRISITIGQRYILAPEINNKTCFCLIMPLSFDMDNATKDGCTNPQTTTTYFTKKKKNSAAWVRYDKGDNAFTLNDMTKEQWESAAKNELSRSRCCGYKRFNQPILFNLIMNDGVRKRVFDNFKIR